MSTNSRNEVKASLEKVTPPGQTKSVAPSVLREFLDYNQETGALHWRKRDQKWFTTEGHWSGWNKRFAGKAVTGHSPAGYCLVVVYRRAFLAHRVIWAMVHDYWPVEIDHINGDRSDNRLSNLREVSHAQNHRNKSVARSHRVGEICIEHRPKGKFCPDRWIVRLQRVSDRLVKRTFYSLEDAVAFRDETMRAAGFHENHGRKPVARKGVREFAEAAQ